MSESTTEYDHVRAAKKYPMLDILRSMQGELAETEMILQGITGRVQRQRRNIEAICNLLASNHPTKTGE